MCWSAPASFAMVAVGVAATTIAIRRRETPAIPITFGYFTAMEALQAASYPVLDQCGAPANQVLALLSYLHITFQPFFANAFAMAIVGHAVRPGMRLGAYIACGLSAMVMVLQLYPFAWAGLCPLGVALCGTDLCTVSGTWHLGWTIPYNNLVPPVGPVMGFTLVFPTYFIATFLVPLLYGAWRIVLFHALFGPILARALTSDVNEFPAVWCLFSIGIIVVALSPWIRSRMSVAAPLRPRTS